MSAAIDTEGARFYVSTIEGYPISQRALECSRSPVVVATVIDSFYGTEHGRFASNDTRKDTGYLRKGDSGYGPRCACGDFKSYGARHCRACSTSSAYLGRHAALAAAAERCAELNAWHEREGWGEDVPLAS
jgi:hypothetical protein